MKASELVEILNKYPECEIKLSYPITNISNFIVAPISNKKEIHLIAMGVEKCALVSSKL